MSASVQNSSGAVPRNLRGLLKGGGSGSWCRDGSQGFPGRGWVDIIYHGSVGGSVGVVWVGALRRKKY